MKIANKTKFLMMGLALIGLAQGSICQAEKIEAVIEGREVFVSQRADNFIIMYDSSSSMNGMYNGSLKAIDAERQILMEKNAILPELPWQAGIFSFTPGFSTKSLTTHLPMQTYNKEKFAESIKSLPSKPSGPTLLQGGLQELDKILATLSGNTAVILFTDGQYSRTSGKAWPGALAKTLASKYDVCFSVIDTNSGNEGDKEIQKIAAVNGCSKTIPFDGLLGHPEWLTNLLFDVMEKDTIEVVTDKETIVEVVEGDVVLEYQWKNILFDYDKDAIRPDDLGDLAEIITFLKENPEMNLVLAGYTDSIGTVEFNQKLSERRAQAVADFIIKEGNIDPSRIMTRGFGEKDPVATNMYKAGRQQNRRVQGAVVAK